MADATATGVHVTRATFRHCVSIFAISHAAASTCEYPQPPTLASLLVYLRVAGMPLHRSSQQNPADPAGGLILRGASTSLGPLNPVSTGSALHLLPGSQSAFTLTYTTVLTSKSA